LGLRGVVSPSLLFHSIVELARVEGHTRTPTKPRKSRVYDCGGVCYLSCARGSGISSSGLGIRRSMSDVLRARIWCALTLISLLATTVQWLGAASLDSFGD
jgi:hypothetical protein